MHSICTQRVLNMHSICIQCVLNILWNSPRSTSVGMACWKHNMYAICIQYVLNMYSICTKNVLNIRWSSQCWTAPAGATTRKQYALIFCVLLVSGFTLSPATPEVHHHLMCIRRNMHTICTQYARNMHAICTWCVFIVLTRCVLNVHSTCSRFVFNMYLMCIQ